MTTPAYKNLGRLRTLGVEVAYDHVNVKWAQFGAKGNGVQVTDGAMTNGSATLTCATSAPFTVFDIGKIVMVIGAGVGGANLYSTISAFTSSSVVTLANAASTTITPTPVIYGTNDSSAIQSALNYVVAAGGGTVFFPAGIYCCGGARQTTAPTGGAAATYNALIAIHYIDPYAGNLQIKLKGPMAPGPYFQFVGNPAPVSGAIVVQMTDGSGTRPSLLGGPQNDAVTYPNFSSITLEIEKLTFRAGNNPTSSMLDLMFVGHAILRDVAVDIGVNTYAIVLPTTSTAAGIILPYSSNNALVIQENVYVAGHFCGVRSWEHTQWNNVCIQSCRDGVELGGSYHGNFGERLMILQCPYDIVLLGTGQNSGNHYLELDQLNLEHETSGGPAWMAHIRTITDPTSLLQGNTSIHCVQAGVGVDYGRIIIGGATKFRIRRQDSGASLNAYTNNLPVSFSHAYSTIITGNTLTNDGSNLQFGGQAYQDPGALNDAFKTASFTITETVSAYVETLGTKSGSGGILTVTLRKVSDNTVVATFSTLDGYNATVQYNQTSASTAQSIPPGTYYLRGDVLSKNASSAGYYAGLTTISLKKNLT